MTTKTLSRRQARWSEYLSRFNFQIIYQPEKVNGKTDTLTCRFGDFPLLEDERVVQKSHMILKSENFLHIHSADIPADDISEISYSNLALSDIDDSDFAQLEFVIGRDFVSSPLVPSCEEKDINSLVNLEQLWISAYSNKSDIVHQMIDVLQKNNRQDSIFQKLCISMSNYECRQGRLFYRNRIYIPDSSQL